MMEFDEKYSQFLKEYGVCAANALSSDEDHHVYLAIRNLSDLKENHSIIISELYNLIKQF